MATNTGTTTAPKKSVPTYHGTAGKTAIPQKSIKAPHTSDQTGAGNTAKPGKG